MGFITQAIAANFAPLLFLKFHSDYHISLGNIALISTFFFFTQLLVDLFCAKFVDHIGYRVCIVASEIFAALGLLGLAFLPDFLPDPFIGIICSVNCLCHRKRFNRSTLQPYYRGLSVRKQRSNYESTPFVLLLGTGGRGAHHDAFAALDRRESVVYHPDSVVFAAAL